MLDATVLSQVSDARLFATHDALHTSVEKGIDIGPLTDAFDLVASEMARRGLIFKALDTDCTVRGKSPLSGSSSDKNRSPRNLGSPAGSNGDDEDVDGALGPDADLTTAKRGKAAMRKGVVRKADGDDRCTNFTPVRDVCRHCKQNAASHTEVVKGMLWAVRKDAPASTLLRKGAGSNPKPPAAESNGPPPPASAPTTAAPSASDPADPDAPPSDAPGSSTDYTVEQRRQMAENGQAMPDGSFPIANEADLHHAIRLVAQAADPQAALHFIIERAKAMGMEAALPQEWLAAEQDANATPPVPGAHSMPGPAAPKAAPVAKDASLELDESFPYAVIKADTEKRLTLGPVYMPDTLDAHGEWASADDLEAATIAFVKSADTEGRTIFFQHSDRPAGQWVSVMQWPQDVSAHLTVTKSDDEGAVTKSIEDTTFPAGTVYMGIEWEPWAWSKVKKGELTGLSMGGFARRRAGSPEGAAA